MDHKEVALAMVKVSEARTATELQAAVREHLSAMEKLHQRLKEIETELN